MALTRTRNQMISELEEYWENFYKESPDEVGDIPAALEWYRAISLSQLRDEYEDKIGECVEIEGD